MNKDLDRPFKEADELHCYDFISEDTASVLFRTRNFDIGILDVDVSERLTSLPPTALNGGEIETVERMHLISEPTSGVCCVLIFNSRLATMEFATLANPLPWGENPTADSVVCTPLRSYTAVLTGIDP